MSSLRHYTTGDDISAVYSYGQAGSVRKIADPIEAVSILRRELLVSKILGDENSSTISTLSNFLKPIQNERNFDAI